MKCPNEGKENNPIIGIILPLLNDYYSEKVLRNGKDKRFRGVESKSSQGFGAASDEADRAAETPIYFDEPAAGSRCGQHPVARTDDSRSGNDPGGERNGGMNMGWFYKITKHQNQNYTIRLIHTEEPGEGAASPEDCLDIMAAAAQAGEVPEFRDADDM